MTSLYTLFLLLSLTGGLLAQDRPILYGQEHADVL